jgi:MarR family transcriptional regulator for hemolysin
MNMAGRPRRYRGRMARTATVKLLDDVKTPSPISARPRRAAPTADAVSDVAAFNQDYQNRYVPGARDGQEFQVTMYLVLTSRRWRARVADRLREIGQTTARWEALFTVAYAAGEVTQNRLARRLAIEGPTLVRMLHTLEADGLVQRIGSDSHRGAKVIVLTDAGRAVVSQIDDITRSLRDELFVGFTEREIETGLKLLRKLYQRFRTEPQAG